MKDIKRTHPEGVRPEERAIVLAKTARILMAYSHLDTVVSYIQGMNSIVCSIVYSFNESRKEQDRLLEQGTEEEKEQVRAIRKLRFGEGTEEDAFWVFVGLMYYNKFRVMYLNNLSFVQEQIQEFGVILMGRNKEVYDWLTDNDIPLMAYFAPIYLTLFLHVADFRFASKVIEFFFLVGIDAIHMLLRVMIDVHEDKLLEMDQAEIIEFFKEKAVKMSLGSEADGSSMTIASLLTPEQLASVVGNTSLIY
jgi:hypothetical protein